MQGASCWWYPINYHLHKRLPTTHIMSGLPRPQAGSRTMIQKPNSPSSFQSKQLPGPAEPLCHPLPHRMQHDRIDLRHWMRSMEDNLAVGTASPSHSLILEDDGGAAAVPGRKSDIGHGIHEIIPLHGFGGLVGSGGELRVKTAKARFFTGRTGELASAMSTVMPATPSSIPGSSSGC